MHLNEHKSESLSHTPRNVSKSNGTIKEIFLEQKHVQLNKDRQGSFCMQNNKSWYKLLGKLVKEKEGNITRGRRTKG
jgi:hypothetical protein